MRELVEDNEGVLFKVYKGLEDSGLTRQQCIDAVNCMQNEGVLFRERLSD